MKIRMAKRILGLFNKELNFNLLKEDYRKIGVNFITAGNIGLFVTNFTHLTILLSLGSIWLILLGVLLMFFGLQKESK